LILLEEFKKRNVQVLFTSQSYSDSPEDNLILQIQGSIAEYERVKILDRMRRGTIRAVKNGQILGSNAPYGYRYIPKSKSGKAQLEVRPDEAKIVRYIYELFLNENIKGTAISKRLNDEGISCRKSQWWPSQIYAILNNEAHKGIAYMFKTYQVEQRRTPKSKEYRKYKNSGTAPRPREEWIGIPVTPIIDEQTWNRAQKLLKDNAYGARRNNNKHPYLLRRLVVCGLCGSMASGYVSNKSTYYSCGAKRNKNVYSKPHDEVIRVSRKAFDEKVWAGLAELLRDPENIKTQLDKRMQAKKAKLPASPSTSEFDKELSQLAIQEKRILDAYREEVISLEELKTQKEKIASRRKVLEGKKKAVEAFKSMKLKVIAAGDSYNDLEMIKNAHYGALFCAPENIKNLKGKLINLFYYNYI